MSILKSHPHEVARALRTHNYDQVEDGGIYLPRSKVFLGGALRVHDYQQETVDSIKHNLLTKQLLIYNANRLLVPDNDAPTGVSSWYFAPFSGNYTPTDALTGANFASTATEFTKYTGSTRLKLVIENATTGLSHGTSTDSVMEVSEEGPFTIYGVGVLSHSGKSNNSSSSICFSAVRLANSKVLDLGEKLGFDYILTSADAGAA